MPNVRTLHRSFNGGELTPEFFGQITDGKFDSGLALCSNFIVLPHGPVHNRAGFAYVNATKYSGSKTCRLIPFTYSTTQTMVLEFGAGYIRFHTQGATLLLSSTPTAWVTAHAYAIGDLVSQGGTNYYCTTAHTSGTFSTDLAAGKWYALTGMIYEIPTSYAEADLFNIHYVQSADVLTLVHPNYPPAELRRYGATNWQMTTISFVSDIASPTGVTATATSGTGTTTYKYVVTAVGPDGLDESLASSSASCVNNLSAANATNTVGWTAVSGAVRYNIYKQANSALYGYIGQADGTTFVDNNITSDISKTPPIASNPFSGTGNYPAAVSYFEQRRCFAGTTNKPQNIWMTRSGTESNMTYSLPTRDDDSIAFRVAAREANTIQHIVPLTSLVLLTNSAEWRVTPVNSGALTPSSISVTPQSYIGSANVQPQIINNTMIYPAARGGHIRELAYNWQANGYITGDLSLRAPHLFNGMTIQDMAYSKAPYPIVWFVSSDGTLLGLTYVPEQQVGAWHQHTTFQGTFESVTTVTENNYDAVYVVVKRTINGNTVRYVERMDSRLFLNQANPNLADAFFVDSGYTFTSGTPVTTITGLTWLEGMTVNILADGAVMPQQVVSGGTIHLQNSASTVQIGLPITADIQTLPWAAQVDAALGQGRYKNVNKVWLRVYQSSGIFVGPTSGSLTEAKQRSTEPYGSPPALKSDEILIMVTPSWNDSGQVWVRQSDPLPLTIVSMSMEVSVGA